MHHDDEIDVTNKKKPAIIMHYNATKSGVDNLDHLVSLYSCKRKTNRWPMTMLFNIIDCCCRGLRYMDKEEPGMECTEKAQAPTVPERTS